MWRLQNSAARTTCSLKIRSMPRNSQRVSAAVVPRRNRFRDTRSFCNDSFASSNVRWCRIASGKNEPRNALGNYAMQNGYFVQRTNEQYECFRAFSSKS